MKEFLELSVFFPVLCSVILYLLGDLLRRRFGLAVINPLLISVMLTILLLVCLDIDYAVYNEGAKYLSYLLTPATVSLAIPLYRQLHVLRGNTVAVIAGILSGAVSSMGSVFAIGVFFGISHGDYVTVLPKSITTAIGMGVAKELGGDPSVTAAVIIITGIFGSVISPAVLRLFKIKEPIAKGVAMGTASHAIGTSKAMEMGETEGAVSSLSIVVSGIITVVCVSLFAGLI